MFQMPYGDEWRAHRRAFYQHFNEQAVQRYETQISRYTAMFLKLLLDTPGEFLDHSRWCAPSLFLHTSGLVLSDGVVSVCRYAGALILNVVYGFNIRDNEDPHLVAPEKAIAAANAVVTEGFFSVCFYISVAICTALTGVLSVDAFPVCTYPIFVSKLISLIDLPAVRHLPSWFPGARFKRQAAEWRKDVLGLIHDPWRTVQQDLVRLTTLLCVCVTLKWTSVTETRHRLSRRRYWLSWIARRTKVDTTT